MKVLNSPFVRVPGAEGLSFTTQYLDWPKISTQACLRIVPWIIGTEAWKYYFLTGKEERVKVQFAGFRAGVGARPNAKGTEIVYADQRLSAKLVMIENLFR